MTTETNEQFLARVGDPRDDIYGENFKKQYVIDDLAEALRRLWAAEERIAKLEAALQEQWEENHFEHCSRLDPDGECHQPAGCQWPLPAALAQPQPGPAQ